MAPTLLVLVNGLPGSGKSTLAAALAPVLDAQWLSKDAIKEALADVPRQHVSSAILGAAAMAAVWCIVEASSTIVVVDSWWFAPRDRGLVVAALERVDASRVVELWCVVDPDVARSRYARRRRGPIHEDARRLERDWELWSRQAEPLGVGSVLPVDTSSPLSAAAISRVAAALRRVE